MNNTNSKEYQDFLKNNQGEGILNIRVSSISGAIPISNLKIVVSKKIGEENFIFFEGYSDASGIISPIVLKAPKSNSDDLEIPKSTTYDILATYIPDNISEKFEIDMYDNVTVLQKINIVLKNREEL